MPPFEEAVDYFRRKAGNLLPRPEFDRLSLDEKARAFTAAQVMAGEQLNRLHASLLENIESGGTLGDFRSQARNLLTRPFHLETVYRTNVGSAYGAGHFAQAQQAKSLRPYGRLVAMMDGRTRPSHAALHGLVYPLDHPFWLRYWPPYDYNCRCLVETLSRTEIEEQGLIIRYTMPEVLPPTNPNFASPARGGDWQIDLSRYASPRLKQEILDGLFSSYDSGLFPEVDWSGWLALQKRFIRQEDYEVWETALWTRERGGVAGYPEWAAQVLARGRERGEVYPLGNLPEKVLAFLAREGVPPRLSLVVIDDRAILHMSDKVRASEIGGISEKLSGSQWYWDQQDPALLMTWVKAGDIWIKVVVRVNEKIGKGVANRVTTAGALDKIHIERGRRYVEI